MKITLTEALDYERRNSYLISLVATDGASDPLKRLQAKATVAVDVLDVQVKIISSTFTFVGKIGNNSCEHFYMFVCNLKIIDLKSDVFVFFV